MTTPEELAGSEEFAREIHRMYPAGQLDAVMTEYDRRGARVEQLTAALTEIAGNEDCANREYPDDAYCYEYLPRRLEWCTSCIARAALAAAVERNPE